MPTPPLPHAALLRLTCLPSGAVLAHRATVARSMVSRMIGLLGHHSLGDGEALILPRCNSVHTWFMRFHIDVLFLDGHWRVVELLPDMGPWRVSPVVWHAYAVVELASGAARRAGVSIGQQLGISA